MKKILKSFLSMLVVVITLSFLTSCLTQTPGVATLTYKKDAQEKMEYYFNEYKEVVKSRFITDFRKSNKEQTKQYLELFNK